MLATLATLSDVQRVGRLFDRRPFELLFALFCAVVLAVGVVMFLSSRTHASGSTPAPASAKPFDQDAEFGNPIPLPDAAVTVARRFIATAVLRQHLERSWPLLAPSYKQGFTKAQWLRGNIPVVPFPSKGFQQARFKVIRSRVKDVLLEVLLLSHAKGVGGGQIFFIGLEPAADGDAWLVHYWGPRGSSPPIPATPG